MSEKLTDEAIEGAAERVLRRELGRMDRPWSEKTPEEHIEILRREIQGLRMGVQQAAHSAGEVTRRHFELTEQFASHRHDGDEVVIPVRQHSAGGPMGLGGIIGGMAAQREDPLR